MTILAATCLPQVPPEQVREVARAAQDAGLSELWLWEDCFWGGAMSAGVGHPGLDGDAAGGDRRVPGADAERGADRDGGRRAAAACSPAGSPSASATACRAGWARSARAPPRR